MDRTVHTRAIVQITYGPYGPYMIFIPEIKDRMVHTGAVFQILERSIEKKQMLDNRTSSNDHIYKFHASKIQNMANIQKCQKSNNN